MNFFNVDKVRKDFPFLLEKNNGRSICFLDSAASAQKPDCVINKMNNILRKNYANVHRGTYKLSSSLTEMYENARGKIAKYINAKDNKEIIFTKNASEAINLVSYSLGQQLKKGDAVLITEMEHHSNIVPWHILSLRQGVEIRVCPVLDDGSLDLEEFDRLLDDKVKIVAVTHISNVLGTENDIKKLAKKSHKVGAKILIDGSQGICHKKIDVTDLNVDLYAFTGHKLYGPTGIGVLYGKNDILKEMPPFMGGGETVKNVTKYETFWAEHPAKFEAGTPPIVEAIGLGEAIDYMDSIGIENIEKHEKNLYNCLVAATEDIKNLKIIGIAEKKSAVFSFNIKNIHQHDISSILDMKNICVRVGHHCAEPIHKRFGFSGSIRASFGMYNDIHDVEYFAESLKETIKMLV